MATEMVKLINLLQGSPALNSRWNCRKFKCLLLFYNNHSGNKAFLAAKKAQEKKKSSCLVIEQEMQKDHVQSGIMPNCKQTVTYGLQEWLRKASLGFFMCLFTRMYMKVWSGPDKCSMMMSWPTTSISCSECRMFFSTWSALVCMREMSMAKSLAWVLFESTACHKYNFNIQQGCCVVLCRHIDLVCGTKEKICLGLVCLGHYAFVFQKNGLLNQIFVSTYSVFIGIS